MYTYEIIELAEVLDEQFTDRLQEISHEISTKKKLQLIMNRVRDYEQRTGLKFTAFAIPSSPDEERFIIFEKL